jgi:preprotein translocase subunit SecY
MARRAKPRSTSNTRYTTVALCFIQGMMWLGYMRTQGLVSPGIESTPGGLVVFYAAGIAGLTAGSVSRCGLASRSTSTASETASR